jgi:mono/diheme cytochrome c family protein
MNKSRILVFTLLAIALSSARAADVKVLWDKNCAKCHGADGKGATKAGKMAGAKDMTDAKWQTDVTDDRAFKSVKEGIKDGDKVRMKPAEGITDDDIKALIAYTRTFKK